MEIYCSFQKNTFEHAAIESLLSFFFLILAQV